LRIAEVERLWRDCGVIPAVDFGVLVTYRILPSRVSPPAVPPELSTAVSEA
jgi:hypothetical protein